ncbi:MAG: hypothetical protein QW514_06625 [Thermoprotei archaeon]
MGRAPKAVINPMNTTMEECNRELEKERMVAMLVGRTATLPRITQRLLLFVGLFFHRPVIYVELWFVGLLWFDGGLWAPDYAHQYRLGVIGLRVGFGGSQSSGQPCHRSRGPFWG